MGQIINIHCDNCKTDIDLKLGALRKDFEREFVIGYCTQCMEYGSFFREYKTGNLYDTCKCGQIPKVVITQDMIDIKNTIPCSKCNENLKLSIKGYFD